MPDIPVAITVIVQPQATLVVSSGYQTPYTKFATVDTMLATRGKSGDLAYCFNRPDQYWKWSVGQQMWVQANI